MPNLSQSINLQLISNLNLTVASLQTILAQDDLLKAVYEDYLIDIKDPDTPASVLRLVNENRCGSFSTRLVKELRKQGIKSIEASSSDNVSEGHVYVVLTVGDKMILLDPSIAQYIKGFRGIFVGTREELKDYVFSTTTELYRGSEEREKSFAALWGDFSQTAYTNPRMLIQNIK